MNWKQNKIIFSNIIGKEYLIKKDVNTNDILYISWEQFEMKCKYFLAFSVDEQNNILWSCDNPFIDQKTKYFSQNIKINLRGEKIFTSSTLNEIKNLLHNGMSFIFEDEHVILIWCIVGNYKKYKQFYIITEIVYL